MQGWDFARWPSLCAPVTDLLITLEAERSSASLPFDSSESSLAGAGTVGDARRVPPRLAVAVSGGPDSVALAAVVTHLATARGWQVQLWHVAHGLQAVAASWPDQVGRLADWLGVPWHLRKVTVTGERQRREGVEGAARRARHAAFAELAQQTGCRHLLLAHHGDDQAETVLLRLLRGSGPAGLAAMRSAQRAGPLTLWRPWLSVPREQILPMAEQVASQAGIVLAQDPSNLDPSYARAQLRTRVLPTIQAHWPGYRETLLRHARQAAASGALLDEIAHTDLRPLLIPQSSGSALSVVGWRQLPAARASLALRAWLAMQGCRMPTAARLEALEQALRTAGGDRQIEWQHDGQTFSVYRDALQSIPPNRHLPDQVRPWLGEPSWLLPEAGGRVEFRFVAEGVDPEWLRGRLLRLSWRSEGGRLRERPDRPSRAVKSEFQRLGVPPWERSHRLRIWLDAMLLYVAGIGQSCEVPQRSPGLQILWCEDGGTPCSSPPDSAQDDNTRQNAG